MKVIQGSLKQPGSVVSEGRRLYDAGKFSESASFFIERIQRSKAAGTLPSAADLNHAGRAYLAMGDFHSAISFFRKGYELYPDIVSFSTNLALASLRTGRYREAAGLFDGLTRNPDGSENSNAYDGLAECRFLLGDSEGAKTAGVRSLTIKDRTSRSADNPFFQQLKAESRTIRKRPVPDFHNSKSSRNIIAYSLWGNKTRYVDGAVFNARVARVVYPAWTCRFYCDGSVPETVLEELRRNGAQIVMMPAMRQVYHGLFWRFQVVSDPSVDRFLIRDADSPLTCQERVAVDEWIESGKLFHLMRDWYSHSELILAGMWGGVGGVLPDLQPMADMFYNKAQKERTIDQQFLRWCIWPLIREEHLAHDEYFRFGNAVPFPRLGRNPSDMPVALTWMDPAACAISVSGKKRQRVRVVSTVV
ncbi:MAG: hypothetical protein HGA57_04135 [Chlorobium limicola]|uniref:tetratricopeptide repeat protein n=1 Tax=Chlorobium limicola TaxID=1092 RepID=UPI0023F48666|nr:tetratricopeptide repeat protein [Chlorobium limicola]NTV20561.1 hypothetical protein [Chlorobium limicola]